MGIESSQPINGQSQEVEYYPEDKIGAAKLIGLGFQHVLAMFGATVLAPILMGFDPNVAILFSGIGTIIFYIAVGGRIPSYLGSSFAFIAAVAAASGYSGSGPNPNIAIALGGIFGAGLLYFLVGAIVHAGGSVGLEKIFPPAVSGVIVAIIGLSLAVVAKGQIGSEISGVLAGLITLGSAVFVIIFFRNYAFRNFSVLIALIVGYAYYFISSEFFGFGAPIDWSGVQAAPIIGLPEFTAPVFELSAVAIVAPVFVVLVAENLGHIRAIDAMLGRRLDQYVGRAFMADGLATMLASAGGGTGVTTYAENMGVMSATRNFSSQTFLAAGVIAIMLGFSPKFGAILSTIPTPVLGGLAFLLFGLITGAAGIIWQKGITEGTINFGDHRTLISVGIGLVLGAGDVTVSIGEFAMGGIVTATFATLFLYHSLGFLHRLSERPDA